MNQNPILLLDDDHNFRTHVAELLHSRGLNVVQARNGQEASDLLNRVKPALAIVDYRLPGQDGVSWITKVREEGRTFPIVFLSATWCDEKTFTRLRNLLRVSLILRKPIVADLFLQQIENLLPANLTLAPPAAELAVPNAHLQIANTDASATAITGGGVSASEAPASQTDTASSVSNPLLKLKSKLERQQKVDLARAAYSNELPGHWSNLVKAITHARENPTSGVALDEARNLAHKLRGTAGSVGFQAIGANAGKLEDMMHHLDPTDPMQEVIWPEIFRILADGELAIRESQIKTGAAESDKNLLNRKKVIVWGLTENFEGLAEHAELSIDVRASLPELLETLGQDNYSAVFIDMSIADVSEIFMGAKEIRMMHPNSKACIPLGCVLPTGDVPSEELVFAGFSVVLQHGATPAEIDWACQRLAAIEQSASPRVLTVDDDDVLTSFISNVLSSEGMTVQALNQPIKIMETMESFKPELVLLDVMMPGLSGYDICRMLRSEEKWKNLSIVFLTSKSDQEGRAAAFQAGGDDFLSKPVLAEELITRARAQVERVRREEGNEENSAQPLGAVRGREFIKEATEILVRAEREKTQFCVCLLAIDHFSDIGISEGLEAAGRSLATLANLTTEYFRPDVLRGRIGEEGIALIFPSEQKQTIGLALEKLLKEYREIGIQGEYPQKRINCTFSAGVSQFPEDGTTVHKLLSVAYQLMLSGRRGGRGVISTSAQFATN